MEPVAKLEFSYLSLSELRKRVLASGLYNAQTIPDDYFLETLLELLEIRLDDWLGRRLPPTPYTDRKKTNHCGELLLKHFPVISVENIYLVPIEQYGYTATPLSLGPFLANWWQGRKILTGRPNVTVQVSYIAGIEPIPRIFGVVMGQLALLTLKESGTTLDLSFLDAPAKDIQSLSLPGGISKSWKVADLNSGSQGGSPLGTSQLDRVLFPLVRYRLAYLT